MPMLHFGKRVISLFLFLLLVLGLSALCLAEMGGEFVDFERFYKTAQELFTAERYQEANLLFLEMKTYRDSEDYLFYTKGMLALSDNNLDVAASYFSILAEKEFLDSAEYVHYIKGVVAYRDGDLDSAGLHFAVLILREWVFSGNPHYRDYFDLIMTAEQEAANVQSHEKESGELKRIIKIAATNNSCIAAIDTNQKLYVWGDFSGRQDWSGWGINPPENLPEMMDVGIETWGVVALDTMGNLHAWGYPMHGETAFSTDLPPFVSVSVKGHQTAALTVDGQLYAWGENYEGGPTSVPITAGKPHTLRKLAAGPSTVSALDKYGNIYEWVSSEDYGLLHLPEAIEVAMNDSVTIALRDDGSIYGAARTLDNGMLFALEPKVPNISKIYAGSICVAAVDQRGALHIWKCNSKYKNDYTLANVPENLPPVVQVVLLDEIILCVCTDGKVYRWHAEYDKSEPATPEVLDIFSSTSLEVEYLKYAGRGFGFHRRRVLLGYSG